MFLLWLSHLVSLLLQNLTPLFSSTAQAEETPLYQSCKIVVTCTNVEVLVHHLLGLKSTWNILIHVFFVEDLQKVDKDFHPEHLNCSHYSWVHRSTSDGGHDQGYKVGTRLSVDIPRVPEICQGCEKPNGNCGTGLNCLCHPKECKDKVISKAGIKSTASAFFSMLSLIGSVTVAY
uniref:Wall-associated receptor kinase C-terminal domain-containing protein n=1 Tax=Glycine max TaxID=3847 RepID=C6TEI7_SOYBN|nr:unknown [Glycine max]